MLISPRQFASWLAAFGVLMWVGACGVPEPDALPNTNLAPVDTERFSLVARIAHLSDAQIVDEESPGRLVSLARVDMSAWRMQERYSIQLLDGMIRAVNAYHARVAPVDLLVHTGDALDNAQHNELHWFLDCLDGRWIDPLSGVDDRPVGERGPTLLDPHAPFQAEGLYRRGMHGTLPSIPWYAVMGNHDRYAVGIFPIVPRLDGGLMSLLPASLRLGLLLPVVLVPDGVVAYGLISPAHPGPPPPILLPALVRANPDRRFVLPGEFVAAHADTLSGPPGHGFSQDGRTWYAIQAAPGLRLVVLDTSLAPVTIPAGDYHAGGITAEQVEFLSAELARADAAGELVIVATHHPSADLSLLMASALSPPAFRALLAGHRCVVAHLAGHSHHNRVWDRGGYIEFETGAIIDSPHEGRIIEVWQSGAQIALRYASFTPIYTGPAFADLNPPPDDPLLPMRQEALRLAEHPVTDATEAYPASSR